jgi:hypothetical protein
MLKFHGRERLHRMQQPPGSPAAHHCRSFSCQAWLATQNIHTRFWAERYHYKGVAAQRFIRDKDSLQV